eukprot:1298771-Amphidinium_carterae.2
MRKQALMGAHAITEEDLHDDEQPPDQEPKVATQAQHLLALRLVYGAKRPTPQEVQELAGAVHAREVLGSILRTALVMSSLHVGMIPTVVDNTVHLGGSKVVTMDYQHASKPVNARTAELMTSGVGTWQLAQNPQPGLDAT